jgi:hypothetical protein
MNPDDSAVFRHARLVLLLHASAGYAPEGIDTERLGIYDFLAVHPLLLARDDDDPDRLALRLAGFDQRATGYASPTQRYVRGRLLLARDLAALIGRGLVEMNAGGRVRYRLTPQGESVASQFTSMYADSYLFAARTVMRRVRRLSGRKLREGLRQWLIPVGERPVSPLDPERLTQDRHVPDVPSRSRTSGRTAVRKGAK